MSRRVLIALVVLSAAGFAVGAVAYGTSSGGGTPKASPSSAAACREQNLRYEYTDDPRMVDRQRQYEADLLASRVQLPAPRFHDQPVDELGAIHAVSHGYVVVFYREGSGPPGLDDLRRLERIAVAQKAPVLVAPRAQRPALVALRRGVQLTCASVAAAQVKRTRAFAARAYPSLRSDRLAPPEPVVNH